MNLMETEYKYTMIAYDDCSASSPHPCYHTFGLSTCIHLHSPSSAHSVPMFLARFAPSGCKPYFLTSSLYPSILHPSEPCHSLYIYIDTSNRVLSTVVAQMRMMASPFPFPKLVMER